MRRLFTSLGLALGALGFWRWRHRRRTAEPAVEDPADALKRRLAESRSEEPPEAPAPAPEAPTATEPAEPQPSLDERRRAVHDRARQAMDEMLGGENLPGEESD